MSPSLRRRLRYHRANQAIAMFREEYQGLRLDLRAVAETLAATPAVRVMCDVGPIWMHADDTVMTPWIRHYGTWEPEMHRILDRFLARGMTVLDIGANIGYETRRCAARVGSAGRVIAIEPEPANYSLLCANIYDAGLPNVLPLRVAAANHTGVASLARNESNRGDHRTGAMQGRGHVEVACARVDDLLRPAVRVDLIKIDVQGTEHLVVAGMEGVLARAAPVIIAEFWPQGIVEAHSSPAEVLAYYHGLGLSVGRIERPDLDTEKSGDEIVIEAARMLPGGFGTLLLTSRPSDGRDERRKMHRRGGQETLPCDP